MPLPAPTQIHPSVTFNGYNLYTVARIALQLGRPTDDKFAELVHRLSNSPSLPVEIAASFMESAGYVPFEGFPLKRKRS
jgi:hypothetical protein